MIKKIGICACYNTLNYGSMLQSFATQKIISQLGYENEFIRYQKKKTVSYVIKQIPRLLNRNLMQDKYMVMQKKIHLICRPDSKKRNNIRVQAFQRFQNNYYENFSDIYNGYEELKKGASRYDAVVVGSDQLWTPGGLPTNFYNLLFVPDHITKLSYATSFGVNKIPFYQKKRTTDYLKRMKYLSVREINGREIIKKLTGIQAEVVVDPTLLLTYEEWEKVIPEKRIIKEPYIFCYFLGSNAEHRRIATELKDKTGLLLVTTPHLDEYVKADDSFGDKQLYHIGPDDFVNLIRGAEYICTDSFHGSIFSILNHKKFMIFNRFTEGSRGSRNSRIDSLCRLLGLNERRYHSDIQNSMQQEIDYNFVDEKLSEIRNRSLQFLKDALN